MGTRFEPEPDDPSRGDGRRGLPPAASLLEGADSRDAAGLARDSLAFDPVVFGPAAFEPVAGGPANGCSTAGESDQRDRVAGCLACDDGLFALFDRPEVAGRGAGPAEVPVARFAAGGEDATFPGRAAGPCDGGPAAGLGGGSGVGMMPSTLAAGFQSGIEAFHIRSVGPSDPALASSRRRCLETGPNSSSPRE